MGSVVKYETRWLSTLAYGTAGIPKILKYDLHRLVKSGGILSLFMHGTGMMANRMVVKTLCFSWGIAGLTCLSCTFIFNPEALVKERLEVLSEYLNSFIPFVLGLYIALVIDRWWDLRVKALDEVFDALTSVIMLMNNYLAAERHWPVREQVNRYGIVSITLLVKAARDNNDLSDLVGRSLLTPKEAEAVRKVALYQRVMVLWSWITRLINDEMLAAGIGPPLVKEAILQCTRARDGVQVIHTYLNTQLPFGYAEPSL